MAFNYWISIILILLMTATDVYKHTQAVAYCIESLFLQKLSSPLMYVKYTNNAVLLLIQIYQSCLMAFVGYAVVLQENTMKGIFMNYAAILAVR